MPSVSCDFLVRSVDPSEDATLTHVFVSDPPVADDFWADDTASKSFRVGADENDSLPAPPVAPRAARIRGGGLPDVLRPTRAEVRLSHLRHNLAALRRHTKAKIWCVLKADAYGHGAKACARTLERAGADGLCVALIEEAIELREAGVNLPILVMSGYFGASRAELVHYRLTPVIHGPGQLEDLDKEAEYLGCTGVPYHLKLDTGMGRLGIPPRELSAVLREVHSCRRLTFEGLMTHFASADSSPDAVAEQLRRFAAGEQEILARGLAPQIKHAANTAALIGYEATHFDAVRPGIGIYGVDPAPGFSAGLRPAMRLLSTVIALRELQAGQTVGYDGSFTAARTSKIATLPIGYADGFGRQHSNRGHVLIRGQRAPIVGRVSMDLVTVDVTDLPGVAVGDEAVIFGEQHGPLGSDVISAQDIATIEGTIPWEALTSVSRRVPRFYRDA